MQHVKHGLEDFRQTFFREKYRFDQGNAFLVFVNFSLLVVSLIKQSGSGDQYIPLYVGGGLFMTWFFGYILDRVVQVQDIQEKIILKRSPIWKENFEHHGAQSEKLEKLINKLDELEKRLEKTIEKAS